MGKPGQRATEGKKRTQLFRCPGCGKVEKMKDDRPNLGGGLVMSVPIGPPLKWVNAHLWAQSKATGQVLTVAVSACSTACLKKCGKGKGEAWAGEIMALHNKWIGLGPR